MLTLSRQTLRDQIADHLREEIAAAKWQAGESLPPLRSLASRFGCSIGPVQHAVGLLQDEGLLVSRVGAGTFVTERRPVGRRDEVFMSFDMRGHCYGDLAAMLLDHLHRRSICPVTLDGGHQQAGMMLRRACEDARLVIIHGHRHFPFTILNGIPMRGKQLIGVVDWVHGTPPLCGVLVDHQAGGRMVADYLWQRGHRRVALLGTSTMVNGATGAVYANCCHGVAFEAVWRELGGDLRALASLHVEGADDPVVDAAALCGLFSGDGAPTAVFGLRDFETWQAQSVIAESMPERLPELSFVGYGNTPWSQAGRPPLTSVDWNMPAVAQRACRLIDAALDGAARPRGIEWIQPELICRDE